VAEQRRTSRWRADRKRSLASREHCSAANRPSRWRSRVAAGCPSRWVIPNSRACGGRSGRMPGAPRMRSRTGSTCERAGGDPAPILACHPRCGNLESAI
jgi:hypothetical protein